MNHCPYCNSLCVIPIAYGKPSSEMLEAADRGLIRLGGCTVSSVDPNRVCLACKKEWPDPEVTMVSAEHVIRFSEKFRHPVDNAIRQFGASCVECGRARALNGSDSDSLQVAMLRACARVGHAWERFFCFAHREAEGSTYRPDWREIPNSLPISRVIEIAEEKKEWIDNATMLFGVACLEYGRALADKSTDQQRLCDEMLRAHTDVAQAWSEAVADLCASFSNQKFRG